MAAGSLELGAGRSESTAEVLRILRKWGIETLGQLAALDKEELRNRLGDDAVRLWERANGTATRLLKLVQPPEAFEESFEFDHEIETSESLLFILRRFLEQLALRLSSIYLVARELTLTITFSKSEPDGHLANASGARTSNLPKAKLQVASAARTFKIPQPTNDVDLLFRMLQTHLENFKSEHPIVAVALTAQPIRPASQQFGLFETALRNPQHLYETLARLSALLGSDRVGTPIKEETHRPGAFRMEAFTWSPRCEPHRQSTGTIAADPPSSNSGVAGTAASTTQSPSSSPSPRNGEKESIQGPALRRFRPAATASIFTSQDPPSPRLRRTSRHLQSGNVAGKIVDQSGPFLFSGNWWDEKSWDRVEWDMQLDNGDLIRAHEDASPARTLKVDGIYD